MARGRAENKPGAAHLLAGQTSIDDVLKEKYDLTPQLPLHWAALRTLPRAGAVTPPAQHPRLQHVRLLAARSHPAAGNLSHRLRDKRGSDGYPAGRGQPKGRPIDRNDPLKSADPSPRYEVLADRLKAVVRIAPRRCPRPATGGMFGPASQLLRDPGADERRVPPYAR